ncbi:DNA primase large subunit PriL [Candidatus Bilamarchaeum dharawalense]|uniref:DNA primase large subunit PriL n=1 Tax=Candidatus Bilamarchaeum dharawalense TaxID=2885759 RepID=A0A5E4LRM6_9ARCH|nr:DNA primase large subunit PriL [Candidatus Bilamarchaeum dharawalense]
MAEGLDFALKYPFSESAREYIKDLSLSERIVDLGVERIKKALSEKSSPRMLLHESDKKDEIASFASARMILGHLRNNFLTNRFAVNESKIIRTQLDRDDEQTINRVGAIFGIVTKSEGKRLLLDLPTYLRYSLRNPHYRLINRKLYSGFVEVTPDEKKRLIEEAVKKHIENIPLVRDPPDLIKQAGQKLLNEIPKSESRIIIKVESHPPCIAKLLEEMKKHNNLPHHARLYLVTYLLAIGINENQITEMFSDLPDFNEKVTRYQVGHIKKKGYNVPTCATVMTYGLCCAVCRIGHPLNWPGLNEKKGEK